MIKFDRFKDGKKAIVTMSYDDGQIFDRRLVDIFNKYGIRGTFHLNSGNLGEEGRITKEEIPTLYSNHEVSVHTVSHPFLETLTPENALKEVLQDRINLEKYCGYTVRGMSYPFGTYNDSVINTLKNCGIVYSRTTKSTNNFNIPSEFLTWHPTCHHNQNLMEIAKRVVAECDIAWRSPVLYVWGHSYEFDRNNNWEVIEEFCKFIGGRENIWYATNIEIYNYITAQKRLEISVDDKIIYNPSCMTVWINADGQTVEIKGGQTVRL